MARALRIFDAIDVGEKIGITCVGDSITGYNNYGDFKFWPLITYPDKLQELLDKERKSLKVVNCGLAGEKSEIAKEVVEGCLRMFPNSQYYVIGIGTNDMAAERDIREISREIITNIDSAVKLVKENEKQPLVFNVPYLNASKFPRAFARSIQQAQSRRDYHNPMLAAYCKENNIPLIDICSRLKPEHFFDNLHPNEAGAAIIAEGVYSKIKG